MTSAGIAVLIRLYGRTVVDPRFHPRLAAASPAVIRALQVAGVRSLFRISDSAGTALSAAACATGDAG
jgi:hypothetical protein